MASQPYIQSGLDYQRINYSDVASLGNPNLLFSPGLGRDVGLGWDDVNVWKLGMEYKHSNQLTLRAGFSHSNSPISGTFVFNQNAQEVSFNFLTPAIVENHATLGLTYTLASGDELTVAYMHAFENDVSGSNFWSSGSIDTIKMHQNSMGIQYSWKM